MRRHEAAFGRPSVVGGRQYWVGTAEEYSLWEPLQEVLVDPRRLILRHPFRRRHVLLRLLIPWTSHSGDRAVYLWRLPNGDLLVFDGHHRTIAARLRRKRVIPAKIVELVPKNP